MVRAALRQPTASAVAACVGGCPLTHAYRTTDPNNGACPTCSGFLGSGHEYSFDRLAKLLDFDQEGVRGAFRAQYDTDSDVAASYGTFSGLVDDLVRRYNESSGSTMDDAYQNAKAASVYLFFRYPERYHYYKPTVADSLCAAVGSVLPSDPAERFVAYEALCDAMTPAVLSDRDLVALSDSVLDGRQLAADPAHHLLLQDIGYYCDVYMKEWHPDWEDLLEGADETGLVGVEPTMTAPKHPWNLILYGPPGTSKTFYVPALAWLISQGRQPTLRAAKTLSQEELALAKSWYDEQVSDKEGGQVAFNKLGERRPWRPCRRCRGVRWLARGGSPCARRPRSTEPASRAARASASGCRTCA